MVEMNELPDEIVEFIFTYLPPYKDLEECSLVCKRWNSIVKNLIRRSKINLNKGLADFRLCWEVYSQDEKTATKCGATAPSIAGRFAHSAVMHNNSMYIFGGGSSSSSTFNDLWRFDLSQMRWERPISMGSYPSPKGSASMVCWNNQLVLFGGWRYPSLHPPYQPWCLFDELHFYDLEKNRWHVRTPYSSPPPMAGHTATVHKNKMIVFGGYQIADGVNSNSNETWCLDLVDYKWTTPKISGNFKPPPRYSQFQIDLDEDHLLIVGGCGGPNSIFTDAWLLDMSDDIWHWRLVPVRNKKFGASHMWCNPACKVGTKLVVIGPSPNLPSDFQIMKQIRPTGNSIQAAGQQGVGGGVGGGIAVVGGEIDLRRPMQMHGNLGFNQNRIDNNYRVAGRGGAGGGGLDDQYFANRRAILNYNNNLNNNNLYCNNNFQPRVGNLNELHLVARSSAMNEERNQNQNVNIPVIGPSRLNGTTRNDNEPQSSQSQQSLPSSQNSNISNNLNDIEAANRLQRNLALRCRDHEAKLPKRFDEFYEDPFRMAAFNVQNNTRNLSKDHNERIRRMEEKMIAIRNSRRNALVEQKIKEPSPKRIKRNVLSLFVCDFSTVLDQDDPHIEWIEYKNYGIIPGAPERLILSSMVAGHGELILFGGVHKETLSEITHQVSNSVHFLSAPKNIV